jgi:hypothetical protein
MAERAGAKSQLTGVTGAALIILMIVLVPGLFRNLPQPALAAVVITASLSLADIPGTVRLWRQRKTEFLLSIAAFLGVALLGVLPGIAIAVALSILNVFRRAWWPYDTELGRSEGLEGYHDVHLHPATQHLPGLVIYRFDAAQTSRPCRPGCGTDQRKRPWIRTVTSGRTRTSPRRPSSMRPSRRSSGILRTLCGLRGARRDAPPAQRPKNGQQS